MDSQTDGGTNTLASRGLEEPIFQLCCCVSFWFWQEIGFGCTYYYVLEVPYSCGVVLVFFVVCLVGALSLLRLEKKRYSRLSGGCAIIIMTGKKRYSCLSGGCAIIITTEKKETVVCLAGA
jgi:hypothetical protein